MGAVDVDALLPAGQRSEAADTRRGMRRIAVSDTDGVLQAVLYVTRSGQLPAREWIAGQLGETGGSVAEWLAGRPTQPAPDRGPTVCVCHGVGELDILRAVDDGAEDVAAVGRCTQAGTNCGSCRPMIARLLESVSSRQKEPAQ